MEVRLTVTGVRYLIEVLCIILTVVITVITITVITIVWVMGLKVTEECQILDPCTMQKTGI